MNGDIIDCARDGLEQLISVFILAPVLLIILYLIFLYYTFNVPLPEILTEDEKIIQEPTYKINVWQDHFIENCSIRFSRACLPPASIDVSIATYQSPNLWNFT